jgi:hypothetical protein
MKWLFVVLISLPTCVMAQPAASVATSTDNLFELKLDVVPREVKPGEAAKVTASWRSPSGTASTPCYSMLIASENNMSKSEIIALDQPNGLPQDHWTNLVTSTRLATTGQHTVNATISYYIPPLATHLTLTGPPPCPSAISASGPSNLAFTSATNNMTAPADPRRYSPRELTVKVAVEVLRLPTVSGFDTAEFASAMGVRYWSEKDDWWAIEYARQSHDYRTWKPRDVLLGSRGLHLYWKVDHIRHVIPYLIPQQDDHAFIDLTFDEFGILQEAKVDMRVAGRDYVEVVDYATVAAAIVGGPVVGPPFVVAKMIAELNTSFEDWINQLGHTGGRGVFPSVVKENIEIATNALKFEGVEQ